MTGSAPVTFSVCIPNYNYGGYIGATIQSVLDQTYPHYEIVVVDNHSTDDSVTIVESFASDRIRLYRNAYNVGFAPNLDRAAQQARNDFVIMLSADDLMRPAALETYARVISALGAAADNALISSNIEYFDDAGRILHTTTARELLAGIEPDQEQSSALGEPHASVFSGPRVFASVFPRMKVATPFCATAYSRALYERVGGYASVHLTAPDAHFAYKTMLGGACVVFIDKPLFGYRVHGSNQLGLERQNKTLKVPVDHYVFTTQFSEGDLRAAGVLRSDAVAALVDETCLNAALLEAKEGDSRQAFRLLMFSWAVSPAAALRNPKTYLLPFMMLPVAGPLMARALYALRAGWKRRAGPVSP